MLREQDHVRLQHMLDAAEKAFAYSKGKSRRDLENDELLILALVRLLEIVGEAAKNVGEDIKSEYPMVPWKQIAGTRDRLIHGYFNVDLDVVWAILSQDLPPLISSINMILGQ